MVIGRIANPLSPERGLAGSSPVHSEVLVK
jgi:hypothetical protein